jgi:hypothetical protein
MGNAVRELAPGIYAVEPATQAPAGAR